MSRVGRAAALALISILVVACAQAPRAAPTPTDSPPGFVTRSAFDDWPFVADAGVLACNPSGNNDGRLLVTLSFGDGIDYALNGQARAFGFPELDTTVMPNWPDASSLGPIIERGLELCD